MKMVKVNIIQDTCENALDLKKGSPQWFRVRLDEKGQHIPQEVSENMASSMIGRGVAMLVVEPEPVKKPAKKSSKKAVKKPARTNPKNGDGGGGKVRAK